jgi:hypothetical protein
MSVEPTHQPTTIRELAYMAAVAPYVHRPPDEHKLRTLVFKPTNVTRNMNVGPDEHKKTDERMPFSCSVIQIKQLDSITEFYEVVCYRRFYR